MYDHSFVPYADTTALSEDAEKVLIRKLLQQTYFNDVRVQRLLAYYPNLPLKDKDRAISLFMRRLWSDTKFFEAFRAFDFLLAVAGKRGHFVHQFEVFLFGINIILMAQEKGCDLTKVFKFDEIDQVFDTWLFASSVHDFGYPIEAVNKIVKEIGKLYNTFGFKNIQDRFQSVKAENLVKSCNANVGDKVILAIEESLGITSVEAISLVDKLVAVDDHGYASSMFICRMIKNKIRKEKSLPHYEKSLKYAMGAVSLHSLKLSNEPQKDFREYIGKISFEKNPYAFLLFLVDNLQDNNRFVYPKDSWPNYSLHKLSINKHEITISYNVKHPDWKKKAKTAFTSYVTEKREMLDLISPGSTPLGITVRLQYIVDSGKSPVDIVVTI